MKLLFNRAIGKVTRECSRAAMMAKMLMKTGKLPEFSKAITDLQQLQEALRKNNFRKYILACEFAR